VRKQFKDTSKKEEDDRDGVNVFIHYLTELDGSDYI
jgi:hypothetical protein